MPATSCTIMTELFFFNCSYFSPWFFYTSLFNWLEENKAEKWDTKVNIWNAVALKNHFLVFYEMDKGFMSRHVEGDEYMHYWFKEEFCLKSKSSHCFVDLPALCARHGHPSSLLQCHGTAVLVTNSELSFSCLSPASHVYEGQSQSALKLVRLFLMGSGYWVILCSILPPF